LLIPPSRQRRHAPQGAREFAFPHPAQAADFALDDAAALQVIAGGGQARCRLVDDALDAGAQHGAQALRFAPGGGALVAQATAQSHFQFDLRILVMQQQGLGFGASAVVDA
jgi:hypothetical protein